MHFANHVDLDIRVSVDADSYILTTKNFGCNILCINYTLLTTGSATIIMVWLNDIFRHATKSNTWVQVSLCTNEWVENQIQIIIPISM